MPQHSALEIERVLAHHGFSFFRQQGSHRMYRNEFGLQTAVPFHGKNKSVKPALFSAILRQTGLTKEDFS